MSSDLLKEFGAAYETSVNSSICLKTGRGDDVETDDFGDFKAAASEQDEVALSKLSNDLTPAEGASRLPPIPTYTQPLGSRTSQNHALDARQEYVSSGHGVPSPSAAGKIGRAQVVRKQAEDEEWDDFDSASVFFDAEQHISEEQSRARATEALEPSRKSQVPFSEQDQFANVLIPAATQEPILPKKQALDPFSKAATKDRPFQTAQKTEAGNSETPPSNVPPPSILLLLCANIIQSVAKEIKSCAKHDHASAPTDRNLHEFETRQLLKSVSILRSSARILAGRKLRWKRDMILSQGMKIGPAGKQSGMKLASLDKSESRREDQQAAEILRAWRLQVGPLRSNAATINDQLTGSGVSIPEIADSMPVRMGKHSEGAISASKACFLCGLKRDERVLKVDVNVEDSFGEWWLEHWGHMDCVTLWNEHKESLAQR